MPTPLNQNPDCLDSYIEVADSDLFWDDVLGGQAWLNLDSDTKIRALRTAAQELQCFDWDGHLEDPNQCLAFPRSGTCFDGIIPNEIKEAQARLAMRLALSGQSSSTSLPSGVVPVNSMSIDGMNVTFGKNTGLDLSGGVCGANVVSYDQEEQLVAGDTDIDCLIKPFLRKKRVGPQFARICR